MPAGRKPGIALAVRHPQPADAWPVIVSPVAIVLVIDLVAFCLLGLRPIGWERKPCVDGTWLLSTAIIGRIRALGWLQEPLRAAEEPG